MLSSTFLFALFASSILAQLQPLLSSVTFPNNPLINVDITTLSNALLVNNDVLLGVVGPANCPPGGSSLFLLLSDGLLSRMERS